MEKKTMIQLAIEYISKKSKPSKFIDILKYVKTKQNLSDEQAQEIVSELFTQLLTEPSIAKLDGNMWSLRNRCAYDSIKVELEEDNEDSESYDSEDEDDEEFVESEEDGENESEGEY